MKNGKNTGTWFFDFKHGNINVVLGNCCKTIKYDFSCQEMKVIMQKLRNKGYKFFIPCACFEPIAMYYSNLKVKLI